MKRENVSNPEIREVLRLACVNQREVASVLGVALGTVNKRLRLPMPENEVLDMVSALKVIVKNRKKDLESAERILSDL